MADFQCTASIFTCILAPWDRALVNSRLNVPLFICRCRYSEVALQYCLVCRSGHGVSLRVCWNFAEVVLQLLLHQERLSLCLIER